MASRYRLESARSAPASLPRIDREARVIRGVSVCQAGEALGHGIQVDAVALSQIGDAIKASGDTGIKCRFTHPGMCSDGMGKMLGRLKNPTISGDKVFADLHLSDHAERTPTGDLAGYVLDLAEEDPAAFGVSVVFDGHAVWKTKAGEVPVDDGKPAGVTGLPFARVDKLRAADVVDEPAANRDGLFSAFSGTSNFDAAEAFAAIDELRNRVGWSRERAAGFLNSYLSARKDSMTDTAPEVPPETTEKLADQTACPTCGAPVNAEGKHVAPVAEAVEMSRAELGELITAHPQNATEIAQAFAAGRSKAETLAAIASANSAALAAKVTDLETKLAAAVESNAKLRAFAVSAPADPGAMPSAIPEHVDQIKAEWSAMNPADKAVFFNDLEAYRYHRTNGGTSAKEVK